MSPEPPNPQATRYVDWLAIGLPARRFRVRATVAYDTTVALVTEFVLRLLRIAGDLRVHTLQSFFGFSNRETLGLLRDLVEDGLVAYHGDYVQLGPKGRAAFQHGESDDPRIVAIEEVDPVVAFDRATVCPLERTPYEKKAARSLLLLPTKDRDRAARLGSEAARAFQVHFKELIEAQVRVRGTAERAYLYSVDEVIPRRPFIFELLLPVVVGSGTQSAARIDFSELYDKGLKGSRDELISLISEFMSSQLGTSLDSPEALRMIAAFDGGAVSRFIDQPAGEFRLQEWIDHVDRCQATDPLAQTIPVIGSSLTPIVRELLLDRTKDEPDESLSAQVYWSRPSLPYWGRSGSFDGVLDELIEAWGSKATRVLLCTGEDSPTDKDLSRTFRGVDRDTTKFHCGLLMKKGVLPGALELIIRPQKWVAAFAYIRTEPNAPRVPVGLFSRDSRVVQEAGRELSRRLGSLSNSARVIWGYPELTFDQVRELLQRDIESLASK